MKTLSFLCALLLMPLMAPAQEDRERWPDTERCELTAAGGRISVSALCGTLEVPEDPERPEGHQLELAWAVVESRAAKGQPDPVVFLAGGPGQSARDIAPVMSRALRDINRTRDLIFLDQRGTGGSNPLNCEFDEDFLLADPDLENLERELRRCQEQLGADVRFYTTGHGTRDLETLRRHLGLERINLIGGSYGTRMAQIYLRHYPDSVRSVVIDSVVPTRLRLGAEHAEMLDRSIEKLLERCASDTQCNERFPDIQQSFEELKARYREKKQPIRVTHPRTGVAESLDFDQALLASSLRFIAYSPTTQMMIPYLVHEAVRTENPERLAAQALMTSEQMGEQIAIGLNFSVGCSEDWPYWPENSDASGTLLGNSFTDLYRRVCDWWPTQPVGPEFHQPFDSKAPILILSGEFDPVTPPAYGDEAQQQFSNSRHLVAEGRGHIVITLPCMAAIVSEFVEHASVEDLDTECLQRIGPEPFFLDLLGPSP